MTDVQFGTLVELLTDIRDRLTYLCSPMEDGDVDSACQHPDERRLDFSTTRETDWICQDCGHHEQRRATTAPAVSGASAKE
jgi:hypothetical protein